MNSLVQKKIKIFMSGGGTGGSVTPLLAVFDYLSQNGYCNDNFLWIGTKDGVEREMVKKKGIEYQSISAGKLRRYFSWQNFIDPLRVLIAFFQSLFIIIKEKPNLVVSAGGFVSVPLVFAAWLARVPVVIHQQDVRPGLANKLMAPLAKTVTVTFEKSLNDFKRAVWTGNPVRKEFLERCNQQATDEYWARFNLRKNRPVLLVVGGGTGSKAINKLISESLVDLLDFCQVIHVGGKGRLCDIEKKQGYYFSEFLDAETMAAAMSLSDLVLSRCGLGFLTELSFMCKPSIFIPLPRTHQEDNAALYAEKEACVLLNEEVLSQKSLTQEIRQAITNKELLKKLAKNIGRLAKRNSAELIAKELEKILK